MIWNITVNATVEADTREEAEESLLLLVDLDAAPEVDVQVATVSPSAYQNG